MRQNFLVGDIVTCNIKDSHVYGKNYTVSGVSGSLIYLKELGGLSLMSANFDLVESIIPKKFDWDKTPWHIYITSPEHFEHIREFLNSIGKPFPYRDISVTQLTNYSKEKEKIYDYIMWSDDWAPCSPNEIRITPRTVYDIEIAKTFDI